MNIKRWNTVIGSLSESETLYDQLSPSSLLSCPLSSGTSLPNLQASQPHKKSNYVHRLEVRLDLVRQEVISVPAASLSFSDPLVLVSASDSGPNCALSIPRSDTPTSLLSLLPLPRLLPNLTGCDFRLF